MMCCIPRFAMTSVLQRLHDHQDLMHEIFIETHRPPPRMALSTRRSPGLKALLGEYHPTMRGGVRIGRARCAFEDLQPAIGKPPDCSRNRRSIKTYDWYVDLHGVLSLEIACRSSTGRCRHEIDICTLMQEADTPS
jgi:hypothetical protein